MSINLSVSSSDDAVLLSIQNGNRSAQSKILDRFDGLIRAMISKFSSYRASRFSDFVDDVAGETFRQILDPSVSRFDPQRGTAPQYLHGLVANAVRIVGKQRRPISTNTDNVELVREEESTRHSHFQVYVNTLGQRHQPLVGEVIEREELVALVLKGLPSHLADLAIAHYSMRKTLVSLAVEFKGNRFRLARDLLAFKTQAYQRLALAGAA